MEIIKLNNLEEAEFYPPGMIGIAYESGDGDIYGITGKEILNESVQNNWPDAWREWLKDLNPRADGLVIFVTRNNE